MRTPQDISRQIMSGMGIPVEMKNPDKAYHDLRMIESILTKWKKEVVEGVVGEYFQTRWKKEIADECFNRIAEECFNRVALDDEKDRRKKKKGGNKFWTFSK